MTGKSYSLTSGTATNVYTLSFAIGNSNAVGGNLYATVVAYTGTPPSSLTAIQSIRGQCPFTGVDLNGTISMAPSGATSLVNSVSAVSTGTLTATCTVTAGTNAITVAITPTSSLTSPTILGFVSLSKDDDSSVTID